MRAPGAIGEAGSLGEPEGEPASLAVPDNVLPDTNLPGDKHFLSTCCVPGAGHNPFSSYSWFIL